MKIGPLELSGAEAPSYINFRGDTRLALHRLESGSVDSMWLGDEPKFIYFGGTFRGEAASDRCMALERLRLAGGILAFSWSSLQMKVYIKSATLSFHSKMEVDYRIECIVAAERSAAGTNQLEAVTSQIPAISALLDGTGIAPANPEITAISALEAGNTVQAPIAVVAAAKSFQSSINERMSGFSSDVHIDDGSLDDMAIASLISWIAEFGIQARLQIAQGRISEIVRRGSETQL